jgi:hypothetical protein
MHNGRNVAAFLTLAALLMAGGGSAFCTPASTGAMPCCKSAQPCGPGLKQADCCRFVPASPAHAPVATETTLQAKVLRDEAKGIALAVLAGSAAALAAPVAPQNSPPPLPQRESSVPLYILNTSLLR